MLGEQDKNKIQKLAVDLGTTIDGNCGIFFWPYYLIEVLVEKVGVLEKRVKKLEEG